LFFLSILFLASIPWYIGIGCSVRAARSRRNQTSAEAGALERADERRHPMTYAGVPDLKERADLIAYLANAGSTSPECSSKK
jgi:hypothetical protein